jgi:hypothetical protein
LTWCHEPASRAASLLERLNWARGCSAVRRCHAVVRHEAAYAPRSFQAVRPQVGCEVCARSIFLDLPFETGRQLLSFAAAESKVTGDRSRPAPGCGGGQNVDSPPSCCGLVATVTALIPSRFPARPSLIRPTSVSRLFSLGDKQHDIPGQDLVLFVNAVS